MLPPPGCQSRTTTLAEQRLIVLRSRGAVQWQESLWVAHDVAFRNFIFTARSLDNNVLNIDSLSGLPKFHFTRPLGNCASFSQL